jgi:dolichyl-diphosphooligosaccharide--protein glycosyltransferase
MWIMVVFGGMTGYASDDINNFLWMVNIAKDFDKKVSLNQYLWHSKNGKRSSFSVSKKKAPRKLIESTLYKMCYYGWGNIKTDVDQKPGYDRVRKEVIGTHVNTMKHFEESFTSKHFMVRVFKVKPSPLL